MMTEQETMPTILIRIRRIMFSLGDLPSIDADPSPGLSNGEILERLKELNASPQIIDDLNQPKSEGQDT